MFLDDSFRKWARIRDFVPPFGIKGQGMRKLQLLKKMVLQMLAPFSFLFWKLRWSFGLSLFPIWENYCIYSSQKCGRVFTSGPWTSEAGLWEDGLVHVESQCNSGNLDQWPHSWRRILTLADRGPCSSFADSSRRVQTGLKYLSVSNSLENRKDALGLTTDTNLHFLLIEFYSWTTYLLI